MIRIFIISLFLITQIYAKDWYDKNWEYRKVVKVIHKNRNFEEVAVFNFFGKAKPDGSDIRVVDENGKEIPYFLVYAGPGNKYQISLPAKGDIFYVYYGNKDAEKVSYNWKPKAGLILEVYKRKGFWCDNWEKAKRIIERSKKGKLIGRSFWKKIWDGTNPFSSDKDVVKIYTGYFYCRKPGIYYFATSSAGASFLFIDDKLVASWPGWHKAEPFVRPEHSGSIYLTKGIHKLVYYHIGRRRMEISVAAIKIPKRKRFIVIPERFFIPVMECRLIKTEKFGSTITADFMWENTNYLCRNGHQLLTFKFTDKSCGKEINRWEWDFGDGQKSYERNPYHTYLLPGFYNVSLKVEDKEGNIDKITLKVKVEQDYSKIYLKPRHYSEYLEEFRKFNLKNFGKRHLFILADIFLSYNRFDEAYGCFKELMERELEGKEKEKVLLLSADISFRMKKYEEAEKIYKDMLKSKYDPEIALKLANLYLSSGKLIEAKEEFERIKRSNAGKDIKRKAEIGIGDFYRINGKTDKAKQIYEKFTDKKLYELKNGAFAQSVIYYLKIKDPFSALEKIEEWADEFPVAKLKGDWSILKARALILQKDYKEALKELEIFEKNCKGKDNLYLACVFYLKFKIYDALGDKEKAKALYEKLIEEFPGSYFSQIIKK
ncbi:MAG: hypothetical protein DRP67_01265 [Candidatus Omnitrophota bacterium]|nr:MAG: hypothetical protein DRP67_01265 [Candidatus Omnitrophota bacterium]